VARSSIVDRHCVISNQTKARVTMKATEAQSITLIAQDTLISVSSLYSNVYERMPETNESTTGKSFF